MTNDIIIDPWRMHIERRPNPDKKAKVGKIETTDGVKFSVKDIISHVEIMQAYLVLYDKLFQVWNKTPPGRYLWSKLEVEKAFEVVSEAADKVYDYRSKIPGVGEPPQWLQAFTAALDDDFALNVWPLIWDSITRAREEKVIREEGRMRELHRQADEIVKQRIDLRLKIRELEYKLENGEIESDKLSKTWQALHTFQMVEKILEEDYKAE